MKTNPELPRLVAKLSHRLEGVLGKPSPESPLSNYLEYNLE